MISDERLDRRTGSMIVTEKHARDLLRLMGCKADGRTPLAKVETKLNALARLRWIQSYGNGEGSFDDEALTEFLKDDRDNELVKLWQEIVESRGGFTTPLEDLDNDFELQELLQEIWEAYDNDMPIIVLPAKGQLMRSK